MAHRHPTPQTTLDSYKEGENIDVNTLPLTAQVPAALEGCNPTDSVDVHFSLTTFLPSSETTDSLLDTIVYHLSQTIQAMPAMISFPLATWSAETPSLKGKIPW
jgi:hypothetical protein